MTAGSIQNVWVVVDKRTVAWLQGKPREECFAFAIQSAQVIADEIYPDIKEWMDRDKCMPSIMIADPFSKDNAVEAVVQTCKGGNPEWRRIIGNCESFLTRTGNTEFGGEVAVVVGCG